MTPLRYYVLPRIEVARLTRHAPIPSGFLRDWEAARPGILDDNSRDIVAPNSRSYKQRHVAYEIVQQVTDWHEADFIYACDWLELFESGGVRQNIDLLIDHLTEFDSKPVLLSWNHDRDAATVPEFENLPPNFFIAQYNTSRPTANDILLPFWNVETRLDWSPTDTRPFRGGFIGFVSPALKARSDVVNAFSRPGWQIRNTRLAGNLSHDEYYASMLQWNFSLAPRGGGMSSYRFFEALQLGCIPILFADDYKLPFPDLPWSKLAVRLPEADAANFELVNDLINGVDVMERRHWIQEARPMLSLKGVQEEVFKRITNFLN